MLPSGEGHVRVHERDALLFAHPNPMAMARRVLMRHPDTTPTRALQLDLAGARHALDGLPCWARSQRGCPPLPPAPSTWGPRCFPRPPCPATFGAPRTPTAPPAVLTYCVRGWTKKSASSKTSPLTAWSAWDQMIGNSVPSRLNRWGCIALTAYKPQLGSDLGVAFCRL